MELKNDLLLRTLQHQPTKRKPVWLMRQAGRILPEYRQIRETVRNFKDMVKNPNIAAEVTLQPVDLLGVDAAIIFSDILVIPEAMGLTYEIAETKGPYFPKPVQTYKDIEILRIAEPEQDLAYVLEAIRIAKKALNHRVPLIGFAGAPWTIFAYMVEGKGSKTFSKAKAMLYQAPQLAHQLLDKITQSTIAYLKAQINAGANVVQIFDSWAGILSPETYQEFSLRYIQKICEAITEAPLIVFAKGAFFARLEMGKLPCACIGLDWTMHPVTSRQLIGENKVLQGNLDPCVLYADFDTIRKHTLQMLKDFGTKHIANLGHGVYPDIEVDKVKCFIDTVKEFET
ncbi:MAG: uroporphyrinogen decarboxylase [Microscillaceae bacterium]|nr:uroporphyrinogen decarboxylase [Microscillaceae bacterium]MDW8460711.1 uroporphyrinogen decarboxylase [Cytophagales bacterium]